MELVPGTGPFEVVEGACTLGSEVGSRMMAGADVLYSVVEIGWGR